MHHYADAARTAFMALTSLWAASEIWLGWRRRSGDRQRTRDHGTLALLLIAIYASLGAAIWLSFHVAGHFSSMALPWLGLSLMATGMLLRFWAIRVLARFFTVDVSIRDDHQLIRHGPYRWLRHPSYTGALMTFLGFALALGNLWSLLVLMLPVTTAFLWRIRIEERVLAEAFPGQYPDYARHTQRLIPYVW